MSKDKEGAGASNDKSGSNGYDCLIAVIRIIPTILNVWLVVIAVALCLCNEQIRDALFHRVTAIKTPLLELDLATEAKNIEAEISSDPPRSDDLVQQTNWDNLAFRGKNGIAYDPDFYKHNQNLVREITLRARELKPILTNAVVLWVDDHPEHNNGLRRVLEQFGIKVDLAASNEGATNLFHQNHENYDAVISNVHRDVGKSGIDFIVAGDFRNVPVLLYCQRSFMERDPLPNNVYAATHRPDYLIVFLFDLLSRGGAPFAAGYQYNDRSLNSTNH